MRSLRVSQLVYWKPWYTEAELESLCHKRYYPVMLDRSPWSNATPRLYREVSEAIPLFEDCKRLNRIVSDTKVGEESQVTLFLLLIHIYLYEDEERNLHDLDDDHGHIYDRMRSHRVSGHKASWVSLFSPIDAPDELGLEEFKPGWNCKIEVKLMEDGQIYFRYLAIDEK